MRERRRRGHLGRRCAVRRRRRRRRCRHLQRRLNSRHRLLRRARTGGVVDGRRAGCRLVTRPANADIENGHRHGHRGRGGGYLSPRSYGRFSSVTKLLEERIDALGAPVAGEGQRPFQAEPLPIGQALGSHRFAFFRPRLGGLDAAEGMGPGQQLVNDAREGEDVVARVRVEAIDQLRAGIKGAVGPQRTGVEYGFLGIVLVGAAKRSGDAKIDDLYLPLLGEKNIVRGQIKMNDAIPVSIR